jgi:hypothetical protein
MLFIGLAFLVDWILQQVFTVVEIKAVLVTAIIFIVLGLLVGDGPSFKAPWSKP